jgi:SEC-C motif
MGDSAASVVDVAAPMRMRYRFIVGPVIVLLVIAGATGLSASRRAWHHHERAVAIAQAGTVRLPSPFRATRLFGTQPCGSMSEADDLAVGCFTVPHLPQAALLSALRGALIVAGLHISGSQCLAAPLNECEVWSRTHGWITRLSFISQASLRRCPSPGVQYASIARCPSQTPISRGPVSSSSATTSSGDASRNTFDRQRRLLLETGQGGSHERRARALISNALASDAGGSPSESRVKRGDRVVGTDKELVEKLGANDPCPCGSGRRFQAMLPVDRPVRRGARPSLCPRPMTVVEAPSRPAIARASWSGVLPERTVQRSQPAQSQSVERPAVAAATHRGQPRTASRPRTALAACSGLDHQP